MKSIIIKLSIALLIFIAALCTKAKIKELQTENRRLSDNQEVLFDSLRHYVVADSLNAVRTGVLELTLKEYEKYRAEDARIIKQLKADVLAAAASVKTETTAQIKTEIRDSIIYRDRIVDTLKVIRYDSEWTSIYGQLKDSGVDLCIRSREKLILTETLQRKRVWFIKLPPKIFGYRSKGVDVVSMNPNTRVVGVDYVRIIE